MQRNNNPGRILKGTAIQPTLKSASGVWTINEALQAHRNNSWPQPNLFQPIPNSMRLKYNANGGSFFQRLPGKAGDQRKWTYSAWVKRSLIANSTSDDFELFCAGWNNTYYAMHLNFQNSTDTIQIYDWGLAGGGAFQLVTSPIYRDTNAWLHVVCAVDTTQSTNTNRVKIYVNGVQVTVVGGSNNWGASSGFPNQSYATPVNGLGLPQQFGSCYVGGANAKRFDGYISELNFIDGAQLQPTMFGQFDSNNTWVPIQYTGSYGTNGFYAPFTNNTTSQTLGYDAGLNGTPTYTADQDPYRGSVALHLTGNGPAGQQNNTFIDISPSGYAIARNSTATQGSFSPFPKDSTIPYNSAVHGASAFFNGTSDYLQIGTTEGALTPLNTAGAYMTIEAWVYPTSLRAGGTGNSGGNYTHPSILGMGSTYFNFGVDNGTPRFYWWTGAGNGLNSSITISANAWSHIALVFNGSGSNNLKIYVNGSLGGTATFTNLSWASASGGNNVLVGSEQAQPTTSLWPGYISNLRITNAAIYTSNFTPMMRPFGTATNNLLPFSEDFALGPYNKAQTSITTNAAVAPDGTPTASKLVESAGTVTHYMDLAGRSYTASTVYTYSIYVKAAERSAAMIYFYGDNGVFSGKSVWFNLLTGTIAYTGAGISSYIQNVGNGWYRLTATATASASATGYIGLYMSNSVGSTDGTVSYTGDGTSGMYIWGAQLETGSSATNYTPTPANYSTAPVVLLNFAGAAVTDSASANNIVTVSNATITNASKYGTGALAFNGASYLTIPGTTGNTSFSTLDFTVECWWKANTTQSSYAPIISQGFLSSPPAGTWGLKVAGPSTNIQFTYDASLVNVGQNINSNINANDGSWHHLAVSRNNSTLNLYIDGILVGNNSIPASQVVGNTTNDIFIGYQSRDGAYINGTVDDLRITKGLGRYPAAFTPPVKALPEVGGKSFTTSNVNAGVVQKFTSVGTASWTAPSDVTQVEVLVVAGGGGGGRWGGGGGAGGLVYNNSYPVTPGQTYTVTVGSGGAGWAGDAQAGGNAGSGTNSIFGNLTAIGGGGGGNYGQGASPNNGLGGGSGGGGGSNGPNYNNTTHTGGSGTAGQGFNGGSSGGYYQGTGGTLSGSGGGGGAGGAGANFGTPTGGASLMFGISGTPTYYAGGGGGMMQTGGTLYAGGTNSGGSGGGGSGTALTSAQIDGVANTGGGGGGTQDSTVSGTWRAGNGGSGIVIVRYTTNTVGNTSDLTTDTFTDSPTSYGHDLGVGGEVVGNYATWNPVDIYLSGDIASAGVSWSNGNLTIANVSAGWLGQRATIAYPNYGQWYYEVHIDSGSGPGIGSGVEIGIITSGSYPNATTTYLDGNSTAYAYRLQGVRYVATSGSQIYPPFNIGDTIGVAFDAGAGTLNFYKNGVNVGNPITGIPTTINYMPAIATYAVVTVSTNFGQRPWAYSPPAGYQALTLKNFQRPAIGSAAATPNQFFDVVTWTGTGAAQNITGLNFQPDFVWAKSRSGGYDNVLNDVIRGPGKTLQTDVSSAEVNEGTAGLTSFNSNGFSLGGSSGGWNASAATYVGWCWKAGGAPVSNTAGTITSQVSVNTASGFSIVTYTGNGVSTATVGHGLGAVPAMIIHSARSTTTSWFTNHIGIPNAWIQLYTTAASVTGGGTNGAIGYQSTNTSSTFTFTAGASTVNNVNQNGTTYVAYCWTPVPGFSQFGSYTGNGSLNGPFIYCGFKPRWIMTKRTDSTGDWLILDTARNPSNPMGEYLIADSSGAANGNYILYDIVSNGFKLRIVTDPNINTSTIIYMAFADKPFGNVNGTAR